MFVCVCVCVFVKEIERGGLQERASPQPSALASCGGTDKHVREEDEESVSLVGRALSLCYQIIPHQLRLGTNKLQQN